MNFEFNIYVKFQYLRFFAKNVYRIYQFISQCDINEFIYYCLLL